MNARIIHFECFHLSRDGRKFFYLDFDRNGTKEEKKARKEIAAILTQEKETQQRKKYHQDVEGTGYVWRVEASIMNKYADKLDTRLTVEEAVELYKNTWKIPPEPIYVKGVGIPVSFADTIVDIVHLYFEEPQERLTAVRGSLDLIHETRRSILILQRMPDKREIKRPGVK
jgi:hypothetical protein